MGCKNIGYRVMGHIFGVCDNSYMANDRHLEKGFVRKVLLHSF